MERTTINVDGLAPTAPEGRLFGVGSYVLMWWSSLIVIQAFVLGQGLLPPNGKLNLLQGLLIMVSSAVIIAVMFSLNGQAGLKYGIPYSVHARAGFGVRGARVVEFLRVIPAIVWYGVGTWIAALSFDGILKTLTGFAPPLAKYVYFVGFQGLQTWLAYRGIRTMKWFNVSGSVVIGLIMTYMLVHILTTYGLEIEESWREPGTWGTPFWVGLTAAIGALATMMLNIGDVARHLVRSQPALWWGHLLGIVPPWFFMLFLGLVSGASLGIWDPVQALMSLSPHPAVMLILLTFILIAQFTTNLTINILPPALIFMDAFRIRWGMAVVFTGVLGVVASPWLIMANMESFFGFIIYYSAVFGPILGVMIADYFVVRKRELKVGALYDKSDTSEYWFMGGFNAAGLVSIAAASTVAIAWFLEMSWLVGLPLGFILYVGLYPIFAGPR